jgi:L-malate glycosyltransferase
MTFKILIIPCFGYPSPTDLYNSGFIHIRALAYKKAGYEVKVFVPNFKNNSVDRYNFEGIDVEVGNRSALDNILREYHPDRLLIHFINVDIMNYLASIKFSIPSVIWIHGYEALSWHRIFFEYKNLKQFSYLILTNIRQLYKLRDFVERSEGQNVMFVFVSNWMHRITTTDTFKQISNYRIIPNPIDSQLFRYIPKTTEARKHILLVRSFSSTKYANDIAIDAIVEMSKQPFFKDLNFTIAGKGLFFDKLTKPLQGFENVTLLNRFLTQTEISAYHKTHGILLCPTRMDAQGVSMCEGMMSGLVPVTSNNTAIPEFVTNDESGFLTDSSLEIASKIALLYHNPERYMQMSLKAHQHISRIAGDEIIIKKEVETFAVQS